MNVSSVKNLNGETFSAVQDATLTDVVQSNSAQWGQGTVATSAGIVGDGTTQNPLRVELSATNDANVNNIVLTASLPATPDANTLYLIPET